MGRILPAMQTNIQSNRMNITGHQRSASNGAKRLGDVAILMSLIPIRCIATRNRMRVIEKSHRLSIEF
jgi:hypothetical protein